MVFFPVHPLAESDPDERTEARQQTPAREALAWLEDPESRIRATVRTLALFRVAFSWGKKPLR